MSIKMQCKACLKSLEIPDEFAGKKGKCPFCFQVLDIPLASDEVSVRPAGATPEKPAPPEKPVAKFRPQGPVRLGVMLPVVAGLLVLGAIAYVVIQKMFSPADVKSDYKVTAPVKQPDEVDEPLKPSKPSAATRFPATVKVAAALSGDVNTYIEIAMPSQFLLHLGKQPLWKNKTLGADRCTTAYAEICRAAAYRFGQKPEVIEAILKPAKTVHLAFYSSGDWPVAVLDLGKTASPALLLGANPPIKPERTVESHIGVLDEYSGNLERRLLIGYRDSFAVIGDRHDYVQNTLRGLAADAPEGLNLMNTPAFVHALGLRDDGQNWLFVRPAADVAMREAAVSGMLPVGGIDWLQATLDIGNNRLSGSLSSSGELAAVLGEKPITSLTAGFAPPACAAYVAAAAGDMHAQWLRMLGCEPQNADEIRAALGPEYALLVFGAGSQADGKAIVAQVADAKLLKAALQKTQTVVQNYRGYQLVHPDKAGQVYAYNDAMLIVGSGEAAVKSCIDAAASGNSLAKSRGFETARKQNAILLVVANPAALLPAKKEPLFAEDALMSVAVYKEEGVNRIAGDLNALGVLCAYFSDTAQQRQLAQERARKDEIARSAAECARNLTEISNAINLFIADDDNLEVFQYPRRISEVIKKGHLTDTSLLCCPLDKTPGVTADNVQSSYDFVFGLFKYGLSAGFSMQAIVAWERQPNHDGKHQAIFIDGQVRLLTPEELKQAIEQARDDAAAKTKPVNLPPR